MENISPVYVYVYIYIYIYTCSYIDIIYTYIYIYIYMYKERERESERMGETFYLQYICVYIYIYITHMYVYMQNTIITHNTYNGIMVSQMILFGVGTAGILKCPSNNSTHSSKVLNRIHMLTWIRLHEAEFEVGSSNIL